MLTYKVRLIDGSGTGEPERICNDLAKEGWRLVSTAVTARGALEVVMYLFFEHAAAEPC